MPDGDHFAAAGVAVVRAVRQLRWHREFEPHGGFRAEVVGVHHHAADWAILGDPDLLRTQHQLHTALGRRAAHGDATERARGQ